MVELSADGLAYNLDAGLVAALVLKKAWKSVAELVGRMAASMAVLMVASKAVLTVT